ncbi:MAG: hypothetical protein D6B28_02400 [Gammaproteobacteria bacterium]|nr:MAG: hypothetical protein D6B28_02400 [Gammaproteobacteria bacterium]
MSSEASVQCVSTVMSHDLGQEIYFVENDWGGIQVRESDQYIWVHCGGDSVQTACSKADPDRLCLEYMRRMLAFLPFRENRLGDVLLLGLGGGAMVRTIHHYWPDSQIDAIDIDGDMVEIAHNIFGVPWVDNIRIRVADAFCYVEQSLDSQVDTVFVDLFVGEEAVSEVYTESFVANCFEALLPSGVLVFNILAVEEQQFADFVSMVRKVFAKQTLCLNVPAHNNILLFAFKGPVVVPSQEELALRAQLLQDKLILPFEEYMRDMIYYNKNNHLIKAIYK